jgi:hypothetical protein
VHSNDYLVGVKKPKYAKSGLSEKTSNVLYEELIRLVEEREIYKQHDSSIRDLADLIGTHSSRLSQVINEESGFTILSTRTGFDAFQQLISEP